ncbi:ATP-binding cassette domain-containing protein [Methanohalophilus sp.]|uniref:ABC transporter ATP-binding protein n=1 Tax=Methanohalophilus sp. TaxID=1966352 RepID=UPI002604BC7B|nr:ATP-binding cassette domain-containing protein [Methanohalophilus sp.]MDK2893019.1 methyl coenzyme reductase system, component [Methanohalophilus sp.]
MLKIQDISKSYKISSGVKKVLNGINLTVNKGEILGITGKSGCGKSTLLRILRGVESFDGGSIELDGREITPDSGIEGAKFLQHNSAIHIQRNFSLWSGPAIESILRKLYYQKKGYEGLPEPDSPYYDELYEEALVFLRLVGLEEKALHFSRALSGGEKQRLILARQLAARPKLLLLDEPVTMTGPDTKQEIMDVIKQLKNHLSIPIIVVSHLPEVHLYLADRLVYIDEGKVAEEGDPDLVVRHFLKRLPPKVDLAPLDKTKPCITAKDISKRYYLLRVGEVLNLEDISFSINKGEIVSLIGPSGAGKSTILRILEALIPPKEGQVLYAHDGDWVDLTVYSQKRMDVLRKISIMHQEFTLSPHSTIGQQIGFRLALKRRGAIEEARQRAIDLGITDEMLDTIYRLPDMSEDEKQDSLFKMGLGVDIYGKLFPYPVNMNLREYAEPVFEALDLPIEILDKRPDEISGGEHVRAYIAVSLATSPEILMMDEPFGDLDPVTLRDVTNSLKNINRKLGTTIVLVSHHMDFVREVAHRVILIRNNRIEADGDARKVCDTFIKSSNATYLNRCLEDILSE